MGKKVVFQISVQLINLKLRFRGQNLLPELSRVKYQERFITSPEHLSGVRSSVTKKRKIFIEQLTVT